MKPQWTWNGQILCQLYLSYKEKYLFESRMSYAKSHNYVINDQIVSVRKILIIPSWHLGRAMHGGELDNIQSITRYLILRMSGDNYLNYKDNTKIALQTGMMPSITLHWVISPNLSNIDLYNPCLSLPEISNMQTQLSGITDDYLCDPDSSITNCPGR